MSWGGWEVRMSAGRRTSWPVTRARVVPRWPGGRMDMAHVGRSIWGEVVTKIPRRLGTHLRGWKSEPDEDGKGEVGEKR